MRLIVAILFLFSIAGSQKDRTREPGTYGSDIVEAVTGILHEACIFADDTLFLRRLAFVESEDGTNPKTYRTGYNGGIWQVNKDHFDETHIYSARLNDTYSLIKRKLGIDWSSVVWSDLRKPLYSGTAAAMFLMIKRNPSTIPSTTQAQASFWRTYYRPTGTQQDFIFLTDRFAKGCKKDEKMDVLFIVDSSSHLAVADFNKAKDFVKKIVLALNVAPDQVHVALETYSTHVRLDFGFKQYTTKTDVISAIKNVTYIPGSINSAEALRVARNTVFNSTNSRGNGVSKLAIIITSSKSNNAIATVQNAIYAKNKGITIYSIGVGNHVDKTEMQQIASIPPCAHTFSVSNYSELTNLNLAIAEISCKVPVKLQPGEYIYSCGTNILAQVYGGSVGSTMQISLTNGTATIYGSYSTTQPSNSVHDVTHNVTPRSSATFFIKDTQPLTFTVTTERTKTAGTSCIGTFKVKVMTSLPKKAVCMNRKPDIVLLLDAWESKTRDQFNKMLDFATSFASQFDIGPGKAQIGLTTYAETVKNQFWMNEFVTESDVLNAIRRAVKFGTGSNLPEALKFVREVSFTPSHGLRQESSRILVILTTGTPSHVESIASQAKLLHNMGVRIVILAIGQSFDQATLNVLAAGPHHVEEVSGFDSLQSVLGSIAAEVCGKLQLTCVENGVQRNCTVQDLLLSQFGSAIVPDRGGLVNNPCAVMPPGLAPITRFPHPTENDKFILCDDKGESYIVLCPVGELYNGRAERCEFPSGSSTISSIPKTAPIATHSTVFLTANPTTAAVSGTNPCTSENLTKGLFYFPYPADYHKYIHCTGVPGTARVDFCPPGKRWRQSSRDCEYEFVVDATGNVDYSIPNPCTVGAAGFFPHPLDKSSYIHCDNFGQGFIQHCPNNLYFNSAQETCTGRK